MTMPIWIGLSLLLAAVFLTASPSQARPGLLPEGGHPPVFTLPDSTGHLVSLKTFLGPRRIVVLFAPDRAYLETIQTDRAQFTDRDLTVLTVVPSSSPLAKTTYPEPIHLLFDAGSKIARLYGAADDQPAFYLIGKDGHIAAARHGYPTNKELFALIDAMPMRRQEMRERRH